MKLTFSTLLCLSCLHCFSQAITFNSAIKKQYLSAYNKLPADIRKGFEEAASISRDSDANALPQVSLAIIKKFDVDTLNKAGLRNRQPLYKPRNEDMLLCGATLQKDSLVIDIGAFGQDSHIDIVNTIVNKKVKTIYDEYEEMQTIYAHNENDKRENYITLSVTNSTFVLSDSVFTAGKTIYGYCEMATDVYFKDDDNFAEGYIKQRLLISILFKCVIQDDK